VGVDIGVNIFVNYLAKDSKLKDEHKALESTLQKLTGCGKVHG
jgi:hypothetical protein